MQRRLIARTALGVALLGLLGLVRAQEPPQIERRTLAPGLTVEAVRASMTSPIRAGDGIITLVRIDLDRFRLRLLTAEEHGTPRSASAWARDFGLNGVINASMFQPGGRSTGLMVEGTRVNNGSVNARFGAFLAFDPVDPSSPPVAMFGRACPGFDLKKIRENYRVVIQNYRMLGCDGGAVMWKDPKLYSAAAVAVDRDGRVVFIHSRTPYRMSDFNTMLAHPELGLAGAMYVEGGPEASLFVRAGGVTIEKSGSWETGFRLDDLNAALWRIPNVIGFGRRDGD